MSDDYDIGYGKPPKHTRFKPGQSGNLQGRPKGSKNLRTDLLEELSEPMKVTEGGRVRHLSKRRALIKALLARGIKGDDRAAAKILDLDLLFGIEDAADDANVLLSDEERGVIKTFEARVLRRLGAPRGMGDGDAP